MAVWKKEEIHSVDHKFVQYQSCNINIHSSAMGYRQVNGTIHNPIGSVFVAIMLHVLRDEGGGWISCDLPWQSLIVWLDEPVR